MTFTCRVGQLPTAPTTTPWSTRNRPQQIMGAAVWTGQGRCPAERVTERLLHQVELAGAAIPQRSLLAARRAVTASGSAHGCPDLAEFRAGLSARTRGQPGWLEPYRLTGRSIYMVTSSVLSTVVWRRSEVATNPRPSYRPVAALLCWYTPRRITSTDGCASAWSISASTIDRPKPSRRRRGSTSTRLDSPGHSTSVTVPFEESSSVRASGSRLLVSVLLGAHAHAASRR